MSKLRSLVRLYAPNMCVSRIHTLFSLGNSLNYTRFFNFKYLNSNIEICKPVLSARSCTKSHVSFQLSSYNLVKNSVNFLAICVNKEMMSISNTSKRISLHVVRFPVRIRLVK